jgi:hypothetical protein
MLRMAFNRKSIPYRIGKSVRSLVKEQFEPAKPLVDWITARKRRMLW